MLNLRYLRSTAVVLVLAAASVSQAAERSIILQSTTSTKNSGLYDYLLPRFFAESQISVHVVAVGTGQAIWNAQNCDGDALLVHAKSAEEVFVVSGYGIKRFDLMYNDFIIVGPPSDPAGVGQASSATMAFEIISNARVAFASRGDDSGTHKKEMSIWKGAGIDPTTASGEWYLETGSGMGTTLNLAVGKEAYVLTDRATWIKFQNKLDFRILFHGDPALHNQYGVILISRKKCPDVRAELAEEFVRWLLSEHGQEAIRSYVVDGQQLFVPNAKP